jgi:hypothetical protein
VLPSTLAILMARMSGWEPRVRAPCWVLSFARVCAHQLAKVTLIEASLELGNLTAENGGLDVDKESHPGLLTLWNFL